MLGWITEDEARQQGYDFKGWAFGILPVYLAELESEAPWVAMRWTPLEYVFDAFAWLWCTAYEWTQGQPADFGFLITGEL